MSSMEMRIDNLVRLGELLKDKIAMESVIHSAESQNAWFVPQFVQPALDAITGKMLNAKLLKEWMERYPATANFESDKTVGLIMAGNIPLVGFHDFLCLYILGIKAKIKLSTKDDRLFLYVFHSLKAIDSGLLSRMELVEKLENFDAVIATGSGNTNRYFEYYFRNYPKILRKNRNSVGVLSGNETEADLDALADDILMYFGFGCRNVSKLYVPQDYDITILFPHFEKYKWMHHHAKYMNNYDYNRTILLLNNTAHLSNDFLMVEEKNDIASPISVLYYERYGNSKEAQEKLDASAEKIQCIVSSQNGNVPFGKSQRPELWDYADGIDTISFLSAL